MGVFVHSDGDGGKQVANATQATYLIRVDYVLTFYVLRQRNKKKPPKTVIFPEA